MVTATEKRAEWVKNKKECLCILRELLGLDEDSPLEKSLKAAQQASLETMLSMLHPHVDTLEHALPDKMTVEVSKHQRTVTHIVQQCNRCCHNVLNNPITDWTTVT